MNRTKEWLDLGAGLGLLVPQYADRMEAAMRKVEAGGLPDDLEHVTALALITVHEREPWMCKRWQELSQHYHETQCPECKAALA